MAKRQGKKHFKEGSYHLLLLQVAQRSTFCEFISSVFLSSSLVLWYVLQAPRVQDVPPEHDPRGGVPPDVVAVMVPVVVTVLVVPVGTLLAVVDAGVGAELWKNKTKNFCPGGSGASTQFRAFQPLSILVTVAIYCFNHRLPSLCSLSPLSCCFISLIYTKFAVFKSLISFLLTCRSPEPAAAPPFAAAPLAAAAADDDRAGWLRAFRAISEYFPTDEEEEAPLDKRKGKRLLLGCCCCCCCLSCWSKNWAPRGRRGSPFSWSSCKCKKHVWIFIIAFFKKKIQVWDRSKKFLVSPIICELLLKNSQILLFLLYLLPFSVLLVRTPHYYFFCKSYWNVPISSVSRFLNHFVDTMCAKFEKTEIFKYRSVWHSPKIQSFKRVLCSRFDGAT